jgi:predicted transcriptional regulator YheO
MLHDMTGADSSVSKCYFTRAKSGVLMKSETIAIRNREHRVIGLLCINMNLDVPFSQIMSTFIPPKRRTLALPLTLPPRLKIW